MNYSKKEENVINAELLQAFRSGDQSAYKTIYFLYRTPIQAFIARLTKSESDVDDILQEIFIEIWKNREQLDPEEGIKGYLFSITRTVLARFFDKENLLEGVLDDLERGNINTPTIKEFESLILYTIDQMPKQRGDVFRLSKIDGFSNSAIATHLGISEDEVAACLSDAISELKRQFYVFF